MRLTGEEMALASKGNWTFGKPNIISGIGTDSRDFIAGHAFLALRGLSFDGHEHASKVADKAAALIGDAEGVKQWLTLNDVPQLEVVDTLKTLGDLAAYHRKRLQKTRVLAITGSYGKTTVRSMLAHVLETLGLEVSATKANFNNLIGVPKTLMAVEKTSDIALIECGISELGEMERLSEIVQPDVAIVTGVTHAHGEGLGGIHGVAREKAKLMKHLLPQGWCMLGTGVANAFGEAGCNISQTTHSVDAPTAVNWSLTGRALTLRNATESCIVSLALPAKHWAEDMALVAEVVLKLSLDFEKSWGLEDVCEALQTWQAVDGRMKIHTATATQNFTLIDDSYNANPASMQAGLDTLAALSGYRVALIGDMLELGEQAEAVHASLNLHDIDMVITVGAMMSSLAKQNPNMEMRHFDDVQALSLWLTDEQNFPLNRSTLLVKSSHGVGLHEIASYLRNRGQHVI